MKGKGFIQFIVLGIVALIMVGAGAFYLGRQTSKPVQPQNSVVTNNFPNSTSNTKLLF